MTDRRSEMKAVFEKLSKENKNILILVAKSMKAAKEAAEQPQNPSERAG